MHISTPQVSSVFKLTQPHSPFSKKYLGVSVHLNKIWGMLYKIIMTSVLYLIFYKFVFSYLPPVVF